MVGGYREVLEDTVSIVHMPALRADHRVWLAGGNETDMLCMPFLPRQLERGREQCASPLHSIYSTTRETPAEIERL